MMTLAALETGFAAERVAVRINPGLRLAASRAVQLGLDLQAGDLAGVPGRLALVDEAVRLVALRTLALAQEAGS